MNDLGFTHRFVPATLPGKPPLLLLHGTGGDENDLIPLGERISSGAALLSPRGQVLENGMTRFFRRLAEGVFDQADLKLRTQQLADFIARARTIYGLDKPVAVGFSNGANIAASLLLTKPEVLAGAVLIRVMLPFTPEALPDLTGVPVLMLSGATDPLMPPASRDRLADLLTQSGATISHEELPGGHNLTQRDLILATQWLEALA